LKLIIPKNQNEKQFLKTTHSSAFIFFVYNNSCTIICQSDGYVTFNDVDVLNLDPTESGTHPSNQTKIYHREPKKLEIKYVPKLT